MLDINVITSLIGSIGFPIVMCLILIYYIKYLTEKNTEALTQIMNSHKSESMDFKVAIDNNTKAIEMLSAKIDNLERHV